MQVFPLKDNYILLGTVLKVFGEPLGESNTERRVEVSAGVSKEGT